MVLPTSARVCAPGVARLPLTVGPRIHVPQPHADSSCFVVLMGAFSLIVLALYLLKYLTR